MQTLAITGEEVEQVKKQIVSTWNKIQQHDFYTGCGKPDCEWCNFAKNNKIYSSLIEKDSEPEEVEAPADL